jgi:uncharacterized protein involved in exopolysaccharide biosynthesis
MTRISDALSFPPNYDSRVRPFPALERLLGTIEARLPFFSADHVAQSERARRIDYVVRAVSATADKDSSVVTVRATTSDPGLSTEIVNILLQTYMADRLAAQRDTALGVEKALHQRLDKTQRDISTVEEEINTLFQDQKVLLERAEIPNASQDLTIVAGQLAAARREFTARLARLQAFSELQVSARNDPVKLVELLDSGAQSTSDLRRKLLEVRGNLANISAQVGPNHPKRVMAQQVFNIMSGAASAEAARLLDQRKSDVAAQQQVVACLVPAFAGAG